MPQSSAFSEAILDAESHSIRTTKLDVIEMMPVDSMPLSVWVLGARSDGTIIILQ